ncbi:MAG: hypothetical protein ABJF10_18655 [Chthoniobacter sp.]|uniref:hypothetical protein n=1 Tax=Chthoniobacter sp. TaxID=2510640 RepID=UPI0032A8895C
MRVRAVMSRTFPLFFLLSVSFLALGPWTHGRAEEPPNNDEDFTRPLKRFDLRYQFQDKAGGTGQSTFILRRDQPIRLSKDWKLATRLDVPFVLSNGTGRDNPQGRTEFGTGDVLAEAVLVDTLNERFAFGGGLRVLFPTANEDQFGSGKYRLIPLMGARFFLPEISKGSFFQPVVRYDFDAGGYGGRNHVSQLQFSPTLNIQLPDRWFLTLFPSQDIVVNNIGGHKWFLPADFLIGRNLDQRTVASVEVSIPIVKQFTLYDFKLEARVSYSF